MSWTPAEQNKVVEALAITCEVTSTSLSDAARKFMLRELEAHPAKEVLIALRKCTHTCKGKLALADVLRAMTEVDRKQLSDQRAARSAYLTALRICALTELIPWEENKIESIENDLKAKGYKLDKMPGYGTRAEPVKALPHWQETDRD